MNEKHLTAAREGWIMSKLFDNRPNVWLPGINRDGRKQKSAMRQIVEGGYASQTGTEYVWTDKAYQQIEAIKPDLMAVWLKQKEEWNYRHKLPLVLFGDHAFPIGERRYLIDHAEEYEWYLILDSLVNRHAREIGKEDDLTGPIKLDVLGKMRHELAKKTADYRTFMVLVGSPELAQQVKEHTVAEKFDGLYAINLRWGLQQLGVLTEEQAESDIAKNLLKEGDSTTLISAIGGGGFGLPPKPEAWNEDAITMRLQGLENSVKVAQQRLEFFRLLEKRIKEEGGWEKIKEEYKKRLADELAKKQ